MRILVINLDRNPARWQRMADLLAGSDFKRIAAADGKTLAGPEYNDMSRPLSCETLSRYNRACALSHRMAYEDFLASNDPYACILEDDVFISPDFLRFVNNETWLPKNCDLMKIETTQQEISISTKTIPCWDRVAAQLHSLHLGTAAYIVSRRGAQHLLEITDLPDRSIDRIIFGETGLEKLQPVYQLIPALCIQAGHRADGMIFPEMESNIQPKKKPAAPADAPTKKSAEKIRRELARPFRQLAKISQTASLRLRGLRRCRVPCV